MRTIAHQIIKVSGDSAATGMELAALAAVKTNQDWANETTIYRFADESVLEISECNMTVIETADAGSNWEWDGDCGDGDWRLDIA